MAASSSKSHFLSTASPSPRKGVRGSRSTSNLRGGGGGDAGHSLAHELAFALMPEPSAGSKLLAEEFGIEYDEGAEGIDAGLSVQRANGDIAGDAGAGGDATPGLDETVGASSGLPMDAPALQFSVASPHATPTRRRAGTIERNAMELLARDIETTDNFLSHLRRLDTDGASSSAAAASSLSPTSPKAALSSPAANALHPAEPQLEKTTLDVIRRINETARDREGQVRELIGLEREFRRIAGEVGGNDLLGNLDELEEMEGLGGSSTSSSHRQRTNSQTGTIKDNNLDKVLESLPEEREPLVHDWEAELERSRLGGDEMDPALDPDFDPHSLDQNDHHLPEDDDPFSLMSPSRPTFGNPALPSLPPLPTDPMPLETLPHLAHVRTLTTSLVTSLLAISEHAQVNGAATTEAGRKLRALKNKLGEWRDEWEGAEKSRIRIERWEAGESFSSGADGAMVAVAGLNGISRRVDGRKVVEEQLREFERALADAALKTQAIMTSA